MNALLRSWAFPSALLVALASAGCGDEKKTQTVDPDAGAELGPQKPVLGGKLAAAVKAAESAQPAAASRGGDGPPENGVFGPGLADKAHALSAPATLAMLDPGKEPRARLAPAPADEQREGVSLTVRLGGGAIPVDYSLGLKIDKPKDEKKTDGPKSWRVVGKVLSVSLSPQLPHELADKLGKLKGSEVRYTLGPDGGLSELGYTLAKDADPGLGDAVVKGLVDTLGVSMPPLPQVPVGLGAYWMVTDRASTFGVDVVRYRVYKIEKLDKDGATISVDVRQYAAKDDADLGQKLTLQRFDSSGKGKLAWTAQGLLPAQGELTQRTQLTGAVAGGQQGGLQVDVSAKFAGEAPEKKK